MGFIVTDVELSTVTSVEKKLWR